MTVPGDWRRLFLTEGHDGRLGPRHPSPWGTSVGRALFLAGVFLMVTGDWPRVSVLPDRWIMPLCFLAWPWLYPTLLFASFVALAWSGALQPARWGPAALLRIPLGLLTATFLVSVLFSQVPSLSWWAFGCFLVVVGFSLAVAQVVDEDALASVCIVLAAAAVFLAVRVLVWRLDVGLNSPIYHIGNNAWLGKNQIAWVLNLLAPLLLARFLAERTIAATLLYGSAWVLAAAAICVVFSSTGVVVLAATTVSLCALNLQHWRRWLILLIGCAGLAFGLISLSPATSGDLITSLLRPDRHPSVVVRKGVWRQTASMIIDHPISGIGLGTYDDIAHSRYGPIEDPWFFRRGWHAHNTHLHILAETGVLGFLAWCYLWFTIVRFILGRWRDGDRLGRLNCSAVLCVILAFFVHSMTDAIIAARVHASLRMNLTLALLVVYGLRLSAGKSSGDEGHAGLAGARARVDSGARQICEMSSRGGWVR